MDAAAIPQPRHAVQDQHGLAIKLLQSPKQRHTPGPVSPKRLPKRVSKSKAKAKAKAMRTLEKKVSAMDPEAAFLEQSGLFGAAKNPPPRSPSIRSPKSPKLSKPKRGRNKRKKTEEDMYMDDFLLSDEEDKHPGYLGGLRRAERWIPDIDHRPRVHQKPRNVPSQLWMSYCLMDDYIYRQSLTEEEVLAHPLMDEVLEFQQGGNGSEPIPPVGYTWNEERKLVPVLEHSDGQEK
ncbi:uncharacterized protein F4812DRAFT_418098 [Daldinia caldariorum]|uniref:uncharacterized protein n=1 Tax=Daldinia caldariorum TaxID=326644 RepID=UPI002007CED9|nr:uncharacterized protein F4812DRAFT_418098 [Daldinia caldariorum]KAI1470554.1 hypothetical protein F4812DRAFT_418098 [Daldinia caldariorum]